MHVLAGLLQVLAQGSKSGKLTVTQRGAQAIVLLREGRIVYAAASFAYETLGNILVCSDRIDEETLSKALAVQFSSSTPKVP